jgi:hypothetical protein
MRAVQPAGPTGNDCVHCSPGCNDATRSLGGVRQVKASTLKAGVLVEASDLRTWWCRLQRWAMMQPAVIVNAYQALFNSGGITVSNASPVIRPGWTQLYMH